MLSQVIHGESATVQVLQPYLCRLLNFELIMRYQLQVVSNKELQELGVRFRPVEETLRDEVEWYRSQQKDDQGT